MMAEQVFPTKVAGEYFNKRFVNDQDELAGNGEMKKSESF